MLCCLSLAYEVLTVVKIAVRMVIFWGGGGVCTHYLNTVALMDGLLLLIFHKSNPRGMASMCDNFPQSFVFLAMENSPYMAVRL